MKRCHKIQPDSLDSSCWLWLYWVRPTRRVCKVRERAWSIYTHTWLWDLTHLSTAPWGDTTLTCASVRAARFWRESKHGTTIVAFWFVLFFFPERLYFVYWAQFHCFAILSLLKHKQKQASEMWHLQLQQIPNEESKEWSPLTFILNEASSL